METNPAASFPTYSELMYPVLRAVEVLGGSATGGQIIDQVVGDLGFGEAELAVTYESNSKPILPDRITWARSYAKLGGALESPKRSMFLLTTVGKEIVGLPEDDARERLKTMDRDVRSSRTRKPKSTEADGRAVTTAIDDEPDTPIEDEEDDAWKATLLARLHRLTPDGFEEFVLYVLRMYGLDLTRVGGSGDEGIDGIGLAPISEVLSSRVAVQAKRYDPNGPALSREVVALFQRDASAAGAERAVLVTLGRFSGPARKAAIVATPTVDLIDGDRLCELVLEQRIGVTLMPQVNEAWFDRFDG